jgi:uncharacterized protein YfdQ (DUF2303 family)
MTNFSNHNGADGTDVGALADTIARLHEFDVIDATTKGAAPFAVVPEGKTLQSLKPILDSFRVLPDRRRGTANVRDVDSLVELTNRFKSAASAVFAAPDRSAPKVVTVFDYHPTGDDAKNADWLAHRASYAPPLSEEWKAWTERNDKPMSQAEFASFVQDRVGDLIVPKLDDPKLKTFADLVEGVWASPSDMVQLSRKLQVNVESVVRNAQTLNSGELSIIYEEVHTDGAGQPLKVPTLFTIAIPVFYAGELYRIAARLRYRVNTGKITWSYQLVRPDLVFDDAFNEIVAKVRAETSLPVFLGTPES